MDNKKTTLSEEELALIAAIEKQKAIEANLLPKGVTPEQIVQWKKQHQNRIFVIGAQDNHDDKFYVGIFKEPSMKSISAVAHLAKTDEVGSMVLMFNECKVHVDTELETVTSLKTNVMKEMQKMMSVKKTKFRRL